jgi:hypothetical protein
VVFPLLNNRWNILPKDFWLNGSNRIGCPDLPFEQEAGNIGVSAKRK